jgi:hypothetical protein
VTHSEKAHAASTAAHGHSVSAAGPVVAHAK